MMTQLNRTHKNAISLGAATKIPSPSSSPSVGVETNVRIVQPGCDLTISVRRARLKGAGISADVAEKACNKLRFEHGLAAVKPQGKEGGPALLVATQEPIPNLRLVGEDWEVAVYDADASAQSSQLCLDQPLDAEYMPQIIERALLNTLRQRTELWTMESGRIWYEPEPFKVCDGIAAYRRYVVSALHIEGVGIGVAVDVQTAFFTANSIAWHMDGRVPPDERRWRREGLERFMARQDGQKGTLMYDSGGRNRTKCYFEKIEPGLRCGFTGKRRIKKATYDSLLDYYQKHHPNLSVTAISPAFFASFEGIPRPQPISAEHAWARVMNDNLPDSMRDLGLLTPAERREAVLKFWDMLGETPLGELSPGLEEGFWRPDENQAWRIPMPTLEFGGQTTLQPPAPSAWGKQSSVLKTHFRDRQGHLESHGCYFLPPAVSRTIVCPFPEAHDEAARRLAADVGAKLHFWTKKAFNLVPQPYRSIDDGLNKTRGFKEAQLALWVLNGQPSAYHKVEWELDGWGIKRVTQRNLARQFRFLTEGKKVRDRFDKARGRQLWDSFVSLIALDVLCQMEGVPYRVANLGEYDAQIVIDVSHNRRYFGVALLLAREDEVQPFGHYSASQHKLDFKRESLTPRILEDEIVALVKSRLMRGAAALSSILVVRDGKLCGEEQTAIRAAMRRLAEMGKVKTEAQVDTIELHKDTLKALRMWEVMADGSIANVEEGTALQIEANVCLLATTGRATLTQGTADPMLLVSRGACDRLRAAANSCHISAQLNWASPTVAQRLPLALKGLDEDLISRAVQDIVGYR